MLAVSSALLNGNSKLDNQTQSLITQQKTGTGTLILCLVTKLKRFISNVANVRRNLEKKSLLSTNYLE